ncbi:MAG: ATP-binding protein [Spirochaetes bacterium]|nr:ATP-binding protein [Spirochaetota bacterium]
MRKPLILQGARQVGKTYLLKEFAGEYKSYAYFNFEKDKGLSEIFEKDFNLKRIIEYLEIINGSKIEKNNTLIILDEIQVSGAALNSLKYFYEDGHEYHIVSAGSLLGIKISNKGTFPVGKVNFLDLFPMTIDEFLLALGKEEYLRLITNAFKRKEALPKIFHEDLTELLKVYLLTGGMPEAVKIYIDMRDFKLVRKTQEEILNAYLLDFTKYAEKNEIIKLSLIWQSIPSQLAKDNKKFIFTAVKNSARGRDYENALNWLKSCGLIYMVYNVKKPFLPLSAYTTHSHFKVYLLDVGLIGAMSELNPSVLIHGAEIFTHFKGALVENFAAQHLMAGINKSLYFWKSEGKAEVDFLTNSKNSVIPVEIKSGKSLKSKSLLVYKNRYKPEVMFRAGLSNFNLHNGIFEIPLYAMFLLT